LCAAHRRCRVSLRRREHTDALLGAVERLAPKPPAGGWSNDAGGEHLVVERGGTKTTYGLGTAPDCPGSSVSEGDVDAVYTAAEAALPP
jgi:hypothetical protein